MARESNKNRGVFTFRSLLKKHQMTDSERVINDKPYLRTEVQVTENML